MNDHDCGTPRVVRRILRGARTIAFVIVLGCSGGGDTSSPDDTIVRSTTTTVETKADSTSSSTTVPLDVEELGSAISASTGGRMVFFPPEASCVAEAFDELPLPARRSLDALLDEPMSGWSSDRPAAEQVFSAYLGCMDPGALRLSVVLSPLRMNEHECIADAWDGLLTADLMASSLAYGDALDDLPPDVVEEMAAAAAECGPDRQWWVDDIIYQDAIPFDLTSQELECAAARYVDVMGVEEVIRRRLLGAPLLALPPEDEARLDLLGQCNVAERGTLDLLVASPGECLDYRPGPTAGPETTTVTGCDEPHNAEVLAVHDLSADHPLWPGIRDIAASANSHCRADVDRTIDDPSRYDYAWIYPLRRTWEQGDRAVLCFVVHRSGGQWTAPSGAVPTTSVVPTTAVATTSPAAPSPLPSHLGAEVLDFNALAVGTCLYQEPARPDLAEEDRRVWITDCAQPHHGELFHVVVLEGAPGSPFPGEAVVSAQGDSGCVAAFAPYVGVSFDSSRLNFIYLYPLAAQWTQGDRWVQCILYGGTPDELLTRSMAGSGE